MAGNRVFPPRRGAGRGGPFAALCRLGGWEALPAGVLGGGAEILDSGVSEEVRWAVRRIVERTDPESVRRVLLEALLRGYGGLWGSGESAGLLERLFFELGGPCPGDLPRLLRRLEEEPGEPTALRYFARLGTGEAALLALWRRQGVPWLPWG